MAVEKIDTVVVGAGQAGVAMSEHLGRNGIPHVVLERGRIGERWRSARWDSLVANGPAWHDRFPNMDFPEADPDSFIAKDKVAEYFELYAEKYDAPVRCGVDVISVEPKEHERGYIVTTDKGVIEALNVVSATGPFQLPSIPLIVPAEADFTHIHSSQYKNPDQVPEGGVLVVGAGASGVQIAEELARAGRPTWLSVGAHERPPRSYRGRDFVWWLGVLGKWDAQNQVPGNEHVTIAVSGARGGETVDFRALGNMGITLLGMTQRYEDGVMHFADDLQRNVEKGDANYLALLDEADVYIAANGLDLPEEPLAREFGATPDCLSNPVLEVDMKAAGIRTIIWATGFRSDYSWLKADAFDENGLPKHNRGVAAAPGIYFLGLPWLSGRGSSFIWGVWHDAKHIADHIVIQKQYREYAPTGEAASVKAAE